MTLKFTFQQRETIHDELPINVDKWLCSASRRIRWCFAYFLTFLQCVMLRWFFLWTTTTAHRDTKSHTKQINTVAPNSTFKCSSIDTTKTVCFCFSVWEKDSDEIPPRAVPYEKTTTVCLFCLLLLLLLFLLMVAFFLCSYFVF